MGTADKAPIILADDSPTICKMLATILAPLGHPIIIAPDAMNTVRLAMQNRPALCILDLDMPGDADGAIVARTLKRMQIKVLLYSSREECKLKELAAELGCDWHCKIGTTMAVVREHVRKLIEGETNEHGSLANR